MDVTSAAVTVMSLQPVRSRTITPVAFPGLNKHNRGWVFKAGGEAVPSSVAAGPSLSKNIETLASSRHSPLPVAVDSRFKRDGHRSALPSFENLLHDDVRRVPRSANAILRNVECAYLGRRTESEFDRP